MIDSTTGDRIVVSTDGNAGPYIVAPEGRLEAVTDLLDSNSVRYWVDEEAISIDGKPEDAVINLGYGSDPAAIQSLLDNTR